VASKAHNPTSIQLLPPTRVPDGAIAIDVLDDAAR
jgi:hypothetical protein